MIYSGQLCKPLSDKSATVQQWKWAYLSSQQVM